MKKIESGRSMIEMLGVLAIIGVLSIGGLAGYTMAMNRHRATAITDYANRCVVVSQTRGVSGIATVHEAGESCADTLAGETAPTGYTATITAASADSTTVTLDGVTDAVDAILTERMGNGFNGVTYDNTNKTLTYRN